MELERKYPGEIIYCGSFGLKLHGLLEREVKDLDIITTKNYYSAEFIGRIENIKKGNESGSGEFKCEGVKVMCFKTNVMGKGIDVFYTPKAPEFNLIEIVPGVIIKVEKPFGAIKAKVSYLNSNQRINKEKHIADLNYIENLFCVKTKIEEPIDDLPF
jgi:hypothetical protein